MLLNTVKLFKIQIIKYYEMKKFDDSSF